VWERQRLRKGNGGQRRFQNYITAPNTPLCARTKKKHNILFSFAYLYCILWLSYFLFFGTPVIIRWSVGHWSLGSGRVCDCSLLTSVGSLIDSNSKGQKGTSCCRKWQSTVGNCPKVSYLDDTHLLFLCHFLLPLVFTFAAH